MHSFILKVEEEAVEELRICVACGTIITIKHILIVCADLVQITRKYFEERSSYSLFRNVNRETMFDFRRKIGVLYKI